MTMRFLNQILPLPLQRKLKSGWNKVLLFRDKLHSADKELLRSTLTDLDLGRGHIVFVHSSYDQMRSIRATPMELIHILCEVVGETGTVVMPTFPREELYQFIKEGRDCERRVFFDWRRTPSYSGLVTEVFRRIPGTERSLHPTHPVAALGAAAAWLVAGHEYSHTPFDEHSPFQKLFERNAFILRIGRFEQGAMTFRHLADHFIQNELPYPVYSDRPVRVRVAGKDGNQHVLLTKALSRDVYCNHLLVLERMAREGVLRTAKVGTAPVSLVRAQTYIDQYHRYYKQGVICHYLPRQKNCSGDRRLIRGRK